MASPLVRPVAAAIASASILHAVILPHPLVTVAVCITCIFIHYVTASRPASVMCCANTAFALAAAAASGLSHALASSDSSNFGLFVAVVALYHCGEFFAVALSKPADVDNFGDCVTNPLLAAAICDPWCSSQPQRGVHRGHAQCRGRVLVRINTHSFVDGLQFISISFQAVFNMLPFFETDFSPRHSIRTNFGHPGRLSPKGRDAVRISPLLPYLPSFVHFLVLLLILCQAGRAVFYALNCERQSGRARSRDIW